VVAMLAGIQTSQHALAFGAQGHAFSGAVADRLLNPREACQVARLLGTTLQVSATWADWVKDVAPGPTGFTYIPDPRYQLSCEPFETPAGVARMID
jgi:hypothetical protein